VRDLRRRRRAAALPRLARVLAARHRHHRGGRPRRGRERGAAARRRRALPPRVGRQVGGQRIADAHRARGRALRARAGRDGDVARRESTLLHFDPLAADACEWFCARLAGLLLDGPEAASPASDGFDPRIGETVALDRAAAGARAEPLGGFVLAALGVAAAAVASAGSFEEALVWAINLGGDADTNGAIAGALLGARFGEAGIPERWRSVVKEADELGALAERLAAAAS
jgi:hypothetical protein